LPLLACLFWLASSGLPLLACLFWLASSGLPLLDCYLDVTFNRTKRLPLGLAGKAAWTVKAIHDTIAN
jgi:hypothetical protein